MSSLGEQIKSFILGKDSSFDTIEQDTTFLIWVTIGASVLGFVVGFLVCLFSGI